MFDKKIYIMILRIFISILSIVVLLTFASTLYLSVMNKPSSSIFYTSGIDISKITFDNNSDKFLFHIDKIGFLKEGEYLEINGWIFKKEEDINTAISFFVLYDEQDNKYIRVSSRSIIREDVPNNLNINYEISNCGIKGIMNVKMFNANHTYKLYVLYRNNENNILVFLNQSINGLGEII